MGFGSFSFIIFLHADGSRSPVPGFGWYCPTNCSTRVSRLGCDKARAQAERGRRIKNSLLAQMPPFSSYFPGSFQQKQPRAPSRAALSVAVHLTGCSSTLLSPLLGQGHAAKSTGISLVVPMSTQLSGAQKCTNRRRNYIKMDFFKKKKKWKSIFVSRVSN